MEKYEKIIWQLAELYLKKNYDYMWLKTMLEEGKTMPVSGATLITGSSHALNGIYEPAWNRAVNCSMHSQDIYYDYQCAREILSSPGGRHKFARCFIVMGYYIAFQDLSRSTFLRQNMISRIYYPLFGDAHNWEEPVKEDPWSGFGDISEPVKSVCEKAARLKILKEGTYYSALRQRGSYFDLKGKRWSEVSEDMRQAMGKQRATQHNNLFRHKHSLEENQKILCDFVNYLYANDVLPVVVIPPFSDEYNQYVLPEMKKAVLEMIDSVPQNVYYVDFNQDPSLFEPADFMDTDHLSAQGAGKVSFMLAEAFGR